MEVLKRKNEIEDFKQTETDLKRTKIRKNEDSSDSEGEEDLLQRLFGSSKPIQKTPELIENVEDFEDLTNEGNETKEKESEEVKEEDEECVWHDEDDDQETNKAAQTRFSEINSGWLNLKKSSDEPFSGKIFSKSSEQLAEKVVDIEECGRIGIKGMGPVTNFEFHHLAPVAVTSQQDTVVLYQIDGKENGKLQSIRLGKFKVAGCSIISDSEVLCTSNTPWFYSYDIINGEITRHPFLKGATRNHKMTRFYSNPNSDFIAFPTALGGISIISKKNKELVDTLQSGTNSSIDCHVSKDGKRLWNLSENGEVMCFDLRMMKAVNAFEDMFGATSLAVNNSETLFCIGSSSGLINIYDESCQNPDVDGHLSPIKTLKNLRAPITLQRFNRCDEIALFASELVAGQTKMRPTECGNIQLIFGPMFSGKSTELMRRVNRYQIAGKKCLLIKWKKDDRYADKECASHDGRKLAAVKAERLMSLINKIDNYDVIGVDEGQFFMDVVEFADQAANRRKVVLVAALDGTFDRKNFNRILELIPLAEHVTKLNAVCMSCGEDAAFTKRLEANDKRIEVIGGSDKYMAVCRNCWHSNKEKVQTLPRYPLNANFANIESAKENIPNEELTV